MRETEQRNSESMHIDRMTTREMVELMVRSDLRAVEAVRKAGSEIADAIETVTACLKGGGRVFYVGCGTSGRLGIIDATECPPTFGVPLDTFTGVIAGGREAVFCSKEGVEDDSEAGIRDLLNAGIRAGDAVVGISAAGGAKYVLGAVKAAARQGCVTIGITNNPDTVLAARVDFPIVLRTGPEVITGSTRLNAGTAQKLVLNMISTCSMVHLGKVKENLMINLKPANEKLKRRMISIVNELCGISHGEELLEENDWNIAEACEVFRGDHRETEAGSAEWTEDGCDR